MFHPGSAVILAVPFGLAQNLAVQHAHLKRQRCSSVSEAESALEGGQDCVGNVGVGVDGLHIVMVVDGLKQP
jgi:hypothetical protein